VPSFSGNWKQYTLLTRNTLPAQGVISVLILRFLPGRKYERWEGSSKQGTRRVRKAGRDVRNRQALTTYRQSWTDMTISVNMGEMGWSIQRYISMGAMLLFVVGPLFPEMTKHNAKYVLSGSAPRDSAASTFAPFIAGRSIEETVPRGWWNAISIRSTRWKFPGNPGDPRWWKVRQVLSVAVADPLAFKIQIVHVIRRHPRLAFWDLENFEVNR